jgi:hypothetical protein
MYKKILMFVALAVGLLLLQCSDKPTQPEQKIKLGELFTLTPGKTLEVQGEALSLTFRNVLSDSRCPFGVECFWQGMAEIEVKLDNKAGDSALVTPGVLGGTRYNAENPYFIDTLGYRLSFLRLDPYPEPTVLSRLMTPPQPLSEYHATLRIDHAPVVGSMVGSVMITNLPPESIQIAHFQIDSMTIAGDTLNLGVEYGGGCKNHYFFLYMSPATFAESIPVQANLWLRHFDNADSCKCDGGNCYNHRTLRFDLKPIAELCNQMYGESRRIVINTFQYVGQYPEQKRTATYEPTGWTNQAPVISLCCGSGIDSVKEGEALFITVAATDLDGTNPVVQAKYLPSNARFWKSQDDYTFRFEPNYTQSGTYNVLFTASDGSATDSATAPIVVLDAGNQLPRWINGIWSSEVIEGKVLRCRLDAYDPDAKKLFLTANNLPDNSSFVDSGNGRAGFVFFPGASEIGTHVITFTVTDDSGATASMNNSITVNKWVNQKPTISVYRKHQYVAENDTLGIWIGIYDVDGGAPTLSVSNLPPNAIFAYTNGGAGRIDFYPVAGQAGEYHFLCIACDAWDSTLCDTLELSVTVQVATINQGPLIPMALGNYWVFGDTRYESSYFDSTEIVSIYDRDGQNYWRLAPVELLGEWLRSSGDSVFSDKGLQFIPASDTAVLFQAGASNTGAAGLCQVIRLTENVTVPAGTFVNCYQYSRSWSGSSEGSLLGWSTWHVLIIAPGVGVIRDDKYYESGLSYYHLAWQLERYQLR